MVVNCSNVTAILTIIQYEKLNLTKSIAGFPYLSLNLWDLSVYGNQW